MSAETTGPIVGKYYNSTTKKHDIIQVRDELIHHV